MIKNLSPNPNHLLTTCIIFLFYFASFSSSLTAQTHDHFECHMQEEIGQPLQIFTNGSSTNGRAFTPRGNMRFLIVFASFKGYETSEVTLGGWITL